MAKEKVASQKLKLLYIMDYLRENSNEEHPVSVKSIIAYLETQNIFVERKTVYDDIAQLIDYGEDIMLQRGKNGGYFYASREFELPEIKMLVDSVQVSKFITESQSIDLIRKLEKLTDKYNAGDLHRQVVVHNRVKTEQANIFSNIDHISAAINSDCTVAFKYFYYDVRKKPVYKNDGEKYEISPFCLLWDDENYYMLGYDDKSGIMKHYRVDRMKSVSETSNPRLGKSEYSRIDISSYNKKVFNMYHGEEQKVKIRFEKGLVNVVLDKFGKSTTMIPDKSGEYFTISVNVDVSMQFYSWLIGLDGKCEVLEPAKMREDLRRIGQKIADQYK